MKIEIRVLLMLALAAASFDGAANAANGTPGQTGGATAATDGNDFGADPLMTAAQAEMAASNRHDLAGFLRVFTNDAVILADASPYSYRSKEGLTDFFNHSLLGSKVQYSIKPGAPQTEDRVGNRAYIEMVVNVRASDDKGDSFNDPIHWIGVLVRQGGAWKITGLTLTTTGG